MKVRLRTDERGIPYCENAETGEQIRYVTSATVHMGARHVTAELCIHSPTLDLTCDATLAETRQLFYDQNDLESIAAAMAVLVKRRDELERL
jgi:hypothetical protein